MSYTRPPVKAHIRAHGVDMDCEDCGATVTLLTGEPWDALSPMLHHDCHACRPTALVQAREAVFEPVGELPGEARG